MSLKQRVLFGMHRFGVLGAARRVHRHKFQGATVLLYHRVMPADCPADHYVRLMGDPIAPELEALIRYLKRWFRFSTPAECLERWRRGEEVEPYTLLLTFDDGYLDMHEHLLPVLRRCEVPATVFVTTGVIGGGYAAWFQRTFAAMHRTTRGRLPQFEGLADEMPLDTPASRVAAIEAVSALQRCHPAHEWEGMIDRLCEGLGWDGNLDGERMMGWEQVQRLHASGWVTIGGHTVTHPFLDQCTSQQVRRELNESAEELRGRLSPQFLPFSYPQGRCPPGWVQDLVRQAAYGCAFTGQWAANTRKTSLYQLGRQYVPPGDLARASLLLSGLAPRGGGG